MDSLSVVRRGRTAYSTLEVCIYTHLILASCFRCRLGLHRVWAASHLVRWVCRERLLFNPRDLVGGAPPQEASGLCSLFHCLALCVKGVDERGCCVVSVFQTNKISALPPLLLAFSQRPGCLLEARRLSKVPCEFSCPVYVNVTC